MNKQLYNIIKKCNVNILPIHISYRYMNILCYMYIMVLLLISTIISTTYMLYRTIRILSK